MLPIAEDVRVRLRLGVLGPLEVRGPDGPIAISPGKQRSILVLLALRADQVVSRDRLVEELWGDAPPPNAVKALQVHVAQLRGSLAEAFGPDGAKSVLATRAPGYVLRLDAQDLDLACLENAVSVGREELEAGNPAQAHARVRKGLAMWRGPPLADVDLERTLQEQAVRIEEVRVSAQELAVAAALQLGRHVAALPELEGLVAEHPLRERLREYLMLCLYRADRQADALDAYQMTRRVLVDELGIEPGRRLRELQQAILRQDPALDLPTPVERSEAGRAAGFVGRGSELTQLRDGLYDARAGHGGLFLLVGEPGIGKSRLAEELIAHARDCGDQVLVGRCWEAGGAPAYWPWVQALRSYVGDADADELREQLGSGAAAIAQILPELQQRFPELPDPPRLEANGMRFQLFDATAQFIRNLARNRPTIIVLDDLHAADTPSLLLLRFVARELGSARVLLVAALRDVDPLPGRPLTEMLGEVAREPSTRRISLGGLSEAQVAEYVELTVSERASDRLVSALHTESEGNPLFIAELVRLIAVEGVQAEPGSRTDLVIPQSIRDVIARRLTHLSDPCRRLLQVASVLGREFALPALAHMTARSDDELLDHLDEAIAARVVSDVPGGSEVLRFTHVLIRDTLYDGLTSSARVRLERKAVEALEVVYGDRLGPHLSELAHHAIAGSDLVKASAYARRAGDRALALLAYEEAARLYRTALGTLQPGEDEARCELLLASGDAQARGGDLAGAKKAFAQAADLARKLDAPHHLAQAALGYGGRFVWFRAGNDGRLVPLLEDALERLPARDPVRARILARLAGALRDRAVPARRAKLTREAVEIARATGDRSALAYALEGTYAALSWPRDADAWVEMAAELSHLAAETGDRENAFSGHMHTWGGLMLQGDLPAADAELAEIAALLDELGQPAQSMALSTAQAMRACFAGRFEDAERFMAHTAQLGAGGFAAWGGIDDTTFLYVSNFQRWGVCHERGGLDEVRDPIERFVADYPSFFVFRCLLVSLHSQLGDVPQARDGLEWLAADHFAALEVGTEWFFGACLLAEVCASVGAAEPASDLYKALLPYGRFNVIAHPEFSLGSASRYLGLLASTCGRFDEAARHFELALDINATMGARPWVAHTQDDYAQMLVRRDAAGDLARAGDLISEASATYRALGMKPWADAAAVLDGSLRGVGASVRSG